MAIENLNNPLSYSGISTPNQAILPSLNERVQRGVQEQQTRLFSEKVKYDATEAQRLNDFIAKYPEISPDAAVAAIVSNNYNYDATIAAVDKQVKEAEQQYQQQLNASNQEGFLLEKEAYEQYKQENPLTYNPLRNADLVGQTLGMRQADNPLKALSRFLVTGISAPFEMGGNILNLFQSMMAGIGMVQGWNNTQSTMIFKDRNGNEITANGLDMLAYIVGNTQASVWLEEWAKNGYALDKMPDTGSGWFIIDPESQAGLAFEKSLTNTGAMLRTSGGFDVASNFGSLLYDTFANETASQNQEGYQIASMAGQFANYLLSDPKGTVDLAKMFGKGAGKVGTGVKNVAVAGGGFARNPAEAMTRVSTKMRTISDAAKKIGTGEILEKAQQVSVATREKAEAEKIFKQAGKILRKDPKNPEKIRNVTNAFVKMQQANVVYAKALKGEKLTPEEAVLLQEVEPVAKEEELNLVDQARDAKRAEEAEKIVARQERLQRELDANAKELKKVSKESVKYQTLKARRQELTNTKIGVDAQIAATRQRVDFISAPQATTTSQVPATFAVRNALAIKNKDVADINVPETIATSKPQDIISNALINPSKFTNNFWQEFTSNANRLTDEKITFSATPNISLAANKYSLSSGQFTQAAGTQGAERTVGQAVIDMIDQGYIKPDNQIITNLFDNYVIDNIQDITPKELNTIVQAIDFKAMPAKDAGLLRSKISDKLEELSSQAMLNFDLETVTNYGEILEVAYANIPLLKTFLKEYFAKVNAKQKAGELTVLDEMSIAAMAANPSLTGKDFVRVAKLMAKDNVPLARQAHLQATTDVAVFDNVRTALVNASEAVSIDNIDALLNDVRYILNNPNLDSSNKTIIEGSLATLDTRTSTGKLTNLRTNYVNALSEIASETKYPELIIGRVMGYSPEANRVISMSEDITKALINNPNTKLADKIDLIYSLENTTLTAFNRANINLDNINFNNETKDSIAQFITEFLLPRAQKNARHSNAFGNVFAKEPASVLNIYSPESLTAFVKNVANAGLEDLARAIVFETVKNNNAIVDVAFNLAINGKTNLLSEADLVKAYETAEDAYIRYFLILDERLPEDEVYNTLIRLATSELFEDRTAAYYHPRAGQDVRVAAVTDGIYRSDLLDSLTKTDFEDMPALIEKIDTVNAIENVTPETAEVFTPATVASQATRKNIFAYEDKVYNSYAEIKDRLEKAGPRMVYGDVTPFTINGNLTDSEIIDLLSIESSDLNFVNKGYVVDYLIKNNKENLIIEFLKDATFATPFGRSNYIAKLMTTHYYRFSDNFKIEFGKYYIDNLAGTPENLNELRNDPTNVIRYPTSIFLNIFRKNFGYATPEERISKLYDITDANEIAQIKEDLSAQFYNYIKTEGIDGVAPFDLEEDFVENIKILGSLDSEFNMNNLIATALSDVNLNTTLTDDNFIDYLNQGTFYDSDLSKPFRNLLMDIVYKDIVKFDYNLENLKNNIFARLNDDGKRAFNQIFNSLDFTQLNVSSDNIAKMINTAGGRYAYEYQGMWTPMLKALISENIDSAYYTAEDIARDIFTKLDVQEDFQYSTLYDMLSDAYGDELDDYIINAGFNSAEDIETIADVFSLNVIDDYTAVYLLRDYFGYEYNSLDLTKITNPNIWSELAMTFPAHLLSSDILPSDSVLAKKAVETFEDIISYEDRYIYTYGSADDAANQLNKTEYLMPRLQYLKLRAGMFDEKSVEFLEDAAEYVYYADEGLYYENLRIIGDDEYGVEQLLEELLKSSALRAKTPDNFEYNKKIIDIIFDNFIDNVVNKKQYYSPAGGDFASFINTIVNEFDYLTASYAINKIKPLTNDKEFFICFLYTANEYVIDNASDDALSKAGIIIESFPNLKDFVLENMLTGDSWLMSNENRLTDTFVSLYAAGKIDRQEALDIIAQFEADYKLRFPNTDSDPFIYNWALKSIVNDEIEGSEIAKTITEYANGAAKELPEEWGNYAIAVESADNVKAIPAAVIPSYSEDIVARRIQTALYSNVYPNPQSIDPGTMRPYESLAEIKNVIPNLKDIDFDLISLEELTNIFPAIQSPRIGEKAGREFGKLLQQIQENPDAPVTVYRVIPDNGENVIYPGDFVSLSPEYLEFFNKDMMAEAIEAGWISSNDRIITAEINPRDLYIDSRRKFELGYSPSENFPEGLDIDAEYNVAQNINAAARFVKGAMEGDIEYDIEVIELFVEDFFRDSFNPYITPVNQYTQQKLLLNYVNNFLENDALEDLDLSSKLNKFSKLFVENTDSSTISKLLKEELNSNLKRKIVTEAARQNKLSANDILAYYNSTSGRIPFPSFNELDQLPDEIFNKLDNDLMGGIFGANAQFRNSNPVLKIDLSPKQLNMLVNKIVSGDVAPEAIYGVMKSKNVSYEIIESILSNMIYNINPVNNIEASLIATDKKIASAMIDVLNSSDNSVVFEQSLLEMLKEYSVQAELTNSLGITYLSNDADVANALDDLEALKSIAISEDKVSQIISKYINLNVEGVPVNFDPADGSRYSAILEVLSNTKLDNNYKFNVLSKLVENLNAGADKAFATANNKFINGQVIDNWSMENFNEAFNIVSNINNANAREIMSMFIADSMISSLASVDGPLNPNDSILLMKTIMDNKDVFGKLENVRFEQNILNKTYSIFDKIDNDEFNKALPQWIRFIEKQMLDDESEYGYLLARLLYERFELFTPNQLRDLATTYLGRHADMLNYGTIETPLNIAFAKLSSKYPTFIRQQLRANLHGFVESTKEFMDLDEMDIDFFVRPMEADTFGEKITNKYAIGKPFVKRELPAPPKRDNAIDLELDDIESQMSNIRKGDDELTYEQKLKSRMEGLTAKQSILNEDNIAGIMELEDMTAIAAEQRAAKEAFNSERPIEEQLADAAIGIEKIASGDASSPDPDFLMDKLRSRRWAPFVELLASMRNKMDVDDLLGRFVQNDEFITAIADAESYDEILILFEAMIAKGVIRKDNLARMSPSVATVVNKLNSPKSFTVNATTKGQHEARTRAIESGLSPEARKYVNKYRFVEVSESPYQEITDINDGLSVARLFRDGLEYGVRYHMPGFKRQKGERLRTLVDDFAEQMYRATTPEQRITIRNESGKAIAKFFAEEWGNKLPGRFKQDLLNEFNKATSAARSAEIQARNYAAGLDATATFGGQALDQGRLYDAGQLTDTWGMYDISELRNLTSKTYSTMVSLFSTGNYRPADLIKKARYIFDSFWRFTHLARIAFAVRNALLDVTVRNFAGGLPNIITHPREVLASLVSETNDAEWAKLYRRIVGPNSFGIDLNGNPMKISPKDPDWVEQINNRQAYRRSILDRDTRRDPGSFTTSTYGRSIYETVPYDTPGFDKAWANNLVEGLLSPVKLEVWGVMIGKPTNTLSNHIKRFGSVDPKLVTDPQYALAHMLINGDNQAAKDWAALRESYALKGVNQKNPSAKDKASQEIAKQMRTVEGTLGMLFEETGSYAAQWRVLTGNMNPEIVSILSNRDKVFKFGLGTGTVLKKTVNNLEGKIALVRRADENFPQFTVTRRYSDGRSMANYDNVFEQAMGWVARISNTAEKAVGYDLGYREFYMEQVLSLAPMLAKEHLPELRKFAAQLAGAELTAAGETRVPSKKDLETVIKLQEKIELLAESDLVGQLDWNTFKNVVDESAANQVDELYYDAKKAGQFYYAARIYLPFAAAWQDGIRKLAKAPTKRPRKSIPALASAAFWYQYLNQEQSSWLSEVLGTPMPPEGQGYIWTDDFGQKQFYVPVFPYILNLASTAAASARTGGRVPITMKYADGSIYLENLNMFTSGATDISPLLGQPDGSTEVTLPGGGFVLQLAYNTLEPFIGENAVTKTFRNWLQPFGSSRNVLYDYTPAYLRKMLAPILPGVFDEQLERHVSDAAAFLYSTGRYSFPDGTSNTEQRNLLAQDAAALGKLALFGNGLFQSVGPAGIKNHYNIIGKDEMFYARTAVLAEKNKLMEEGLNSIDAWSAIEAKYGLGVIMALATDNTPTGLATSQAYEALRKDPKIGMKATSTFAYLFPGGKGSVELSKYYATRDLGLTIPLGQQIEISQSILWRIQKTRLEEYGIAMGMSNKQIDIMIGTYVAETYGEAGPPPFVDLGYSTTGQDVAELRSILDSDVVKESPVYPALLEAMELRDAGLKAIEGRDAKTFTAQSNQDIAIALNSLYDEVIAKYPDSAILINRVFKKEIGR